MANEIKFYLSGGASNTNPFLSIGGSISNTEIVNGLLNNLWPDVSEADSDVGVTDHKVIYVKNVSGAALADVRAYFGELDQFTGMAILSTTTTNTAVAALDSSTAVVTDYFTVWTNIGETPASTINLNQTNKRVALNISDVKHAAYNQYPDKIDILMAKTGAPTGTATAKIWAMASGSAPSATDNTVLRTLGTLDVSTLATTMTTKTFNTLTDLASAQAAPPSNLQTDRTNLSFGNGTYTSTYHLYAGGLDWTKSVGLLLYTDGSGEFGLKNLSDSYLMAGSNGMIAIAKKNNMVLLTPLSPNKSCADGDGSCWYMGDPPGYAAWVEALVTSIYSQYPIDKNRVAVGGYSSGAQFSMEWWVPSGAAQRTMTDGVIVGISYGGKPQMTEVSYTPSFKSAVFMNWNVGDQDDAYQNDGNFDAKSGFDYYTSAGFQTSLDLKPGQGHDRDGQFGGVMDAQIAAHVPPSTTIGGDGGGGGGGTGENLLPSIGWRIGVEYTGGTSTAHVDVAQTAQPVTSGTGAIQTWHTTGMIRTDTLAGFGSAQDTGMLVSDELMECLSNTRVGVTYDNSVGHAQQSGYIDLQDPSGGEVCDVCEVHANASSATFNDGLKVRYYWDTVTKKCIAPGAAASAQTIPSPLPAIANHGAVSPPAPKLILIFWGTTWNTTNNTYKNTVIDLVQNKLLNADKSWWNTAITDYKFGMPVWEGSVVYSQDLPTGNSYTTAQWKQVISNATVNKIVVDPTTSMFTSQGVNVSNYVYFVIPDPTWTGGITDSEFAAVHNASVFTSAAPPPPTPTPISSSTKGGFSQAWDGSKWIDFAANSPAMNIYTNHGACFQSNNPPPPGGGQPPPGQCGLAAVPQGTIPVAGGGGGAVDHGYALTSATDNGNDGNTAAGAIDRNLNTRWSQNSVNALLTVDMGASHPIDRVKIAWYKGDERQAKFKISYSTDNSTYTNIPPIASMGGGANYISTGTSLALQEFSLVAASPQNAITARYVRYTGLGNTVNTWNSVTEFEIYGPDSGLPGPSPPPPSGINFSKPSSYDTGIPLPNLNNNDFVAIHLERLIPPRSNHVELENYSIVISNEPHPGPPADEPIPGLPGGGGGGIGGDPNLPPVGDIPLPSPPGVFDPGVIPPPQPVPDPPPGGGCPGDPNQPPPPPDENPPPGGGGGGGTGQTPDGIKLVELPAGYSYSDQHTGFHENFQSNGSFRLDVGVQPQLNELNLTFYLNLSSGSDEISSKLSGGTHTDSKAKNGRCYDIGLNQDGSRVRIRKEDPHPDYHDGPSHSISLGSLNGKWVGVQSLKWNEGSNCHLQCWVDTSGAESPTNKWTRILDDIDTGGWFESPYLTCYDSSDSQTTIRVDGMSTSKFHYKFLCATRIIHG